MTINGEQFSLDEAMKGIMGDEYSQLWYDLRNAKTDEEYDYARARVVHYNKMRDGGYTDDAPFTLPVTEWRALSALLCCERAWEEYGYQFSSDIFSQAEARKVFNAMRELSEDGKPVCLDSLVAIGEKLNLDIPQGFLESLDTTFQTNHLAYLLKELKLMAKKREYENVSTAGLALLESGSISADEYKARLMAVMDDTPVEGVATLGDAGQEVLDTMIENAKYEKPIGTLTGFRMLDEVGGLMAGDLIVVAGDTSSGKTSFALSITFNALLKGAKIGYYSLEMPKKRLASRILSMTSKVSSTAMLRKHTTADDYRRVKEALDYMPQTELLFDDKATIKFDDILASIHTLANKYRVNGVIVDYLQILNVNSKGKDTQERLMAEVARKLKNIAMECNIWVMAISQLNRDKNSPEPTLARLRDSGQIAEASDMVLLIYRPEVYGKNYSKPNNTLTTKNTAQIEIAKGRDVGLGKCIVGFDPSVTYFFDTIIPSASSGDTLQAPDIQGLNERPFEQAEDDETVPF